MSFNLRACLYDPRAGDFVTPFFGAAGEGDNAGPDIFNKLDGVSIVARCIDWRALQEHLQVGSVDVVVLNLDAAADPAMRFVPIQQVMELAPNCAVIGISHDTQPDTIIGAMRAGCNQFVKAPIDLADLRAAFDRIRQTRVPAGGGCMQIAVMSAHGGAGGTTLACNLAMEFASLTNHRVGLVDMNLQFGDIACAFDRHPKFSVADVCSEQTAVDRTLLETALDELPCNVALLARPEKLEDALDVSEVAVERLFHALAQMFPFVVVDLPRFFSRAMVAAARASDRIFVVSQLAVPFLRNAARVQRSLLEADVKEDVIEFVLNRCNAEHERIRPAEVEQHFGRKVYATIPNDYKRVTAARDLGHPILAAGANSPARAAIQELAKRIIAEAFGGEGESPEMRSRGMFGFLRRGKGKAKQSSTSG